MIKLIAIDADGTLLDSSSKISKANQAAINKCIQMGLKVVLITGKNLKSSQADH
ncbi:MAG: HAD hydrolase family protein [Actinomycetota bacterium]|nr:HAD hydrolase family protein [Actinomycetota bacterium]